MVFDQNRFNTQHFSNKNFLSIDIVPLPLIQEEQLLEPSPENIKGAIKDIKKLATTYSHLRPLDQELDNILKIYE